MSVTEELRAALGEAFPDGHGSVELLPASPKPYWRRLLDYWRHGIRLDRVDTIRIWHQFPHDGQTLALWAFVTADFGTRRTVDYLAHLRAVTIRHHEEPR